MRGTRTNSGSSLLWAPFVAAAALVAGPDGVYGNIPLIDLTSGPTSLPWTKEALEGTFKNTASPSIVGGWLAMEGQSPLQRGTVAVPLPITGNGQFRTWMPVVLDGANEGAIAALQILFNATNANNGEFEADIIAKPQGGDTLVTAGVFGQPAAGSMTFPGTNCVFLRAEQDVSGLLTLSASADGQQFSSLYSGSVPVLAPLPGTAERVVSLASHGIMKGTVVFAGEPAKEGGTKVDQNDFVSRVDASYKAEDAAFVKAAANAADALTAIRDAADAMAAIAQDFRANPISKSKRGKAILQLLECAADADDKALSAWEKNPRDRAGAKKALLEAQDCKKKAAPALKKLGPLPIGK